jgi:flagellar biogenesis protein FliO
MATPALRFSSSALWSHLVALWDRWLRISRRHPKTLRLCESLPLGERRFVAVVEFEKARFLMGGTASSLVLLARLPDSGGRAEDETESVTPQLAEDKRRQNREDKKC